MSVLCNGYCLHTSLPTLLERRGTNNSYLNILNSSLFWSLKPFAVFLILLKEMLKYFTKQTTAAFIHTICIYDYRDIQQHVIYMSEKSAVK